VTVISTVADLPPTHTVIVALPAPTALATADGMDDDDAPFAITRDTCTTVVSLLVHVPVRSVRSFPNPFSARNKLSHVPRTRLASRGVMSTPG